MLQLGRSLTSASTAAAVASTDWPPESASPYDGEQDILHSESPSRGDDANSGADESAPADRDAGQVREDALSLEQALQFLGAPTTYGNPMCKA